MMSKIVTMIVTIVDMMIINTLAIAEMTASMAPPMADTMAPIMQGYGDCEGWWGGECGIFGL